MKKIVYPLVAALILCLVGIGVLVVQRAGDQRQLKDAQAQIETLLEEKQAWETEKQRVGESLGSVRTVLVKTLVDLEEVSSAIGLPVAAKPSPTPAGTAALTAKPTPAATSTTAPTPAAEATASVQQTERPASKTEPSATKSP